MIFSLDCSAVHLCRVTLDAIHASFAYERKALRFAAPPKVKENDVNQIWIGTTDLRLHCFQGGMNPSVILARGAIARGQSIILRGLQLDDGRGYV
jgi:hypothetical protein